MNNTFRRESTVDRKMNRGCTFSPFHAFKGLRIKAFKGLWSWRSTTSNVQKTHFLRVPLHCLGSKRSEPKRPKASMTQGLNDSETSRFNVLNVQKLSNVQDFKVPMPGSSWASKIQSKFQCLKSPPIKRPSLEIHWGFNWILWFHSFLLLKY